MSKSSLFTLSLTAVAAVASLGLAQAQAQSGKPDFTGVWTSYREQAGAAAVGVAGARRGAPELPLKPEAKAKVDAYRKLVEPTSETPGTHCLGAGMPGSMAGSGGYPMEIMQRAEQINITYEAHNEIRRIYFGNRILPEADRIPDRNGVSSGRWEGDVLVVETDNLKEQVDTRYPHSDKAKVVERYSVSKDPDGRRVLTSEWVMTDPEFYTQPLTGVKKWSEMPNGHVLPYECAEEGWIKYLEALQEKASKSAVAQK